MLKKYLNIFKNMSAPLKASIALMLTQFIQKGLQLVTAPIYTRILPTSQYGEVAVFFSWYEILVIFTGLCLSKGVFNNGMKEFKDDRPVFTFSMYALTMISSFIVGSVVILFCGGVHNFINLPMHLIIFMMILLMFEAGFSLWTVQQRYEYKWKGTTVFTVLIAVLSPIVSILCILFLPVDKVDSRIFGERSVFLLFYLILVFHIGNKAKFKVKTSYWKYALLFNLPLIPHYLSLHILNHTDQIMISRIVGDSAAGIYSVAYNGSSAIKIFWMSMNASLIPWTYEKCENKDFKRLSDVTKVLVMGFAIACILFMFLAPEIMKILAPADYHEGIYVIPPIVAGVFFSAMYYIFANVIYYYKKPKYVMIGSVVSAILNLILNALLIPRFGFVAAGYTTMISYIIQAIIDYCAMRKVIPERIYDDSFLLFISVVIIVISIGLSFIYEILAIRLCLLAVVIAVSAVYIKKHRQVILGFIGKKMA